jgi:protein SCO1/2
MKSARATIGCALALLAGAAANAQTSGEALPDVSWEQRLGEQVPRDARFLDEEGRSFSLGQLSGERPTVLALVYYECPMLCNMVLDGLVRSLRALTFDVGRDFDVVAISIDPRETTALAKRQHDGWLDRYGRAGADAGWHFLTGDESAITAVAGAVGFGYTYVPLTDEYAHAAGLTVLTPTGRVSRVLYGVEFAPRDLRLALVEAGEGTIGTPVDQVLLRCFHYDPASGKYGLAILGLLRVAGIGTVLVLGLLVTRMLRRERDGRRTPITHDRGAREASSPN